MSVGYNGTTEFSNTRTISNMSGAAAWSASIWVFALIGGVAGYPYSISNGGAAPFLWELQLNTDGSAAAVVETAGASVSTGTATSAFINSVFTHFAMVYDGKGSTDADKLKLYSQGVQKTLTFGGAAIGTTLDSLSNVMYLAIREGGSNFYPGFLNQFRMWDIPLTAQEVELDRLYRVPPRTDRLQYWAPLSSRTETTVYTASPLTNTQLTHSTATADGGETTYTGGEKPAAHPHRASRRSLTGHQRRRSTKTVPFYAGYHEGM